MFQAVWLENGGDFVDQIHAGGVAGIAEPVGITRPTVNPAVAGKPCKQVFRPDLEQFGGFGIKLTARYVHLKKEPIQRTVKGIDPKISATLATSSVTSPTSVG